MSRVEFASGAFLDQGLSAVGCYILMATDHDWESSSGGSDPEREPEEMLTKLIQVIMLDCFQRMEWIGPRLCVGEPWEIVHRAQAQFKDVDHNILNDLLPGASTQVKRRRLKDLKALSRKMSRWERHVAPLPKGPPPTLADFQRARQAWQDDLEQRYFELVLRCEHLTPDQRGEVFAITLEFPRGIDPHTLFLSADELNCEQCIEHIQILNALSRHLSRCEATYNELFGDA